MIGTTSTRPRRARPRGRCVASASRAVLRQSTTEGVTYEVHPVAGDGRCLFRSIAAARAVGVGSASPSGRGRRHSEAEETEAADRLREAAVDELIKRRSEVEWFVEGDFDRYCETMRQPRTWGGEPEILMLTHVLRAPIEVFMNEKNVWGTPLLRSIAHYGADEYGAAAAAGGQQREESGGEGEDEGEVEVEVEGEGEGEGGGGGVAVLFHGAGHYEALLSVCEV